MSKYLEDEQFDHFIKKKKDCSKCCKCCTLVEKRLDYMTELLEQLFINKKK